MGVVGCAEGAAAAPAGRHSERAPSRFWPVPCAPALLLLPAPSTPAQGRHFKALSIPARASGHAPCRRGPPALWRPRAPRSGTRCARSRPLAAAPSAAPPAALKQDFQDFKLPSGKSFRGCEECGTVEAAPAWPLPALSSPATRLHSPRRITVLFAAGPAAPHAVPNYSMQRSEALASSRFSPL